jgi:hypothetical protein
MNFRSISRKKILYENIILYDFCLINNFVITELKNYFHVFDFIEFNFIIKNLKKLDDLFFLDVFFFYEILFSFSPRLKESFSVKKGPVFILGNKIKKSNEIFYFLDFLKTFNLPIRCNLFDYLLEKKNLLIKFNCIDFAIFFYVPDYLWHKEVKFEINIQFSKLMTPLSINYFLESLNLLHFFKNSDNEEDDSE